MKLIDFRHVSKQNVLLAEQGAGHEVSHGRVVHLRRVALGFKMHLCQICRLGSPFGFPVIHPEIRWNKEDYGRLRTHVNGHSPPARTVAPPRTLSPSPGVHS